MAQSSCSIGVIMIGAGLWGVQTAVSICQAGVSVLVLEARDRIGGKTSSRGFDGAVSDMGAAWINSMHQSKMLALAQRFDIGTIEQNTHGNVAMHDLDGSVHTIGYG